MITAIVGASGRLGEKTLQCVLDRGVDPSSVIAAVRRPEKVEQWSQHGVQVRRADYDEPESLKAAFQGVDRVLLVPSFAKPAQRVVQYQNALDAARAVGVRHVVHYGLQGTTLESPFLVAPFLLYAESALRTSGMAWTILRNSLYADPIAEWTPSIVKMGTIPYPTGEGRCAYVSRDDIARTGAAVLTTDGHENRVYDLTGPQALSTADLCGIVATVTGNEVEHRPASDEDYVAASHDAGDSEEMTELLLSLYHAVRAGLMDCVSEDVARITGRPAEDFESSLRRRLGEQGGSTTCTAPSAG